MLGSLAYLERYAKADVQRELAANAQQTRAWMPVGRAGWHSDNAEKIVAEFQAQTMKAVLIETGFAKGDPEFLDLFIQNFERIMGQMRW